MSLHIFFVVLMAQLSFSSALPPAILIPGFLSSKMYAKTDAIAEFLAYLNRDLYRNDARKDFFNKAIGMVFSAGTMSSTNNPGWNVYTKPGLSEIEYLSSNKDDPYMATLIDYILKFDSFYKRDDTLVSLNYDWRRSASENSEFHADLKALIEKLYSQNMNTPVAIIAHSMGTAMAMSFFARMSDDWKTKYIHGFFNTAGVLGGNVFFMKLIVNGYDFGSPETITSTEFTNGFVNSAVAYMMPNPQIWTNRDELVSDGTTSYTTANMDAFFSLVNKPIFSSMYNAQKVEQAILLRSPTGIKRLYCAYGYGIETTVSFEFSTQTKPFGSAVTNRYGPGDGAVPLKSMQLCSHWDNVNELKYFKENHFSIMSNRFYLEQIGKMLNAGHRMQASFSMATFLLICLLASMPLLI